MADNEKILLLIDEISNLIALLIELKKNGRFSEALENVNNTLLKYFNCDHHFIYSVSEDFLIDALKEEKGLSVEELSSLAEVLHEKGDILFKQNNLKDSNKILRNALKIYFFLNDNQDFFSFRNMNKMVLINEKLAKINLRIDE